MRKIYVLLTLFLLFSCTVFAFVTSTVFAERENIKISETVLYGDPAVIENLEIQTENYLNYHLFWKTQHKFGKESETKTDYSFSASQNYFNSEEREYEGVILDSGIEYGFFESLPASEQKGLQKAYKELFDSTEYGKEKSKKVYLKDYYDYYPLGIGFDLPHTVWTDYSSADRLKGEPYDALYVTEKFREYFKIPVLESDTVTISVEKGNDGKHYGTGTDETGLYNLYAISKVSRKRNRCFFSINNYKYADFKQGQDTTEYVDTSLIPGGYGIYSFYYFSGDSASRTGIMADRLETVYPLNSETVVKHISLNSDETKLLLFTTEKGSSFLTVIDIETMKALQKITIANEIMGSVYEYDNFAVIETDEKIALISNKNDIYSLEFIVPKASFTNESYQDVWNADYMDYKDGKLAMIGNHFEQETGYELCDFFISVYDKNGLIYYGVYDNNLDLNRIAEFGADCRPKDSSPNYIVWK